MSLSCETSSSLYVIAFRFRLFREAFSTRSASRFCPLVSLPSSSYFIHEGTSASVMRRAGRPCSAASAASWRSISVKSASSWSSRAISLLSISRVRSELGGFLKDCESISRRNACLSSTMEFSLNIPPSIAAPARSCFRVALARMSSSIVASHTSRSTRTSRVWPMRCARSCACLSTWGFQSLSKMITVSAAGRLRPRPPARVERMKMS
mmetsp:Transcript_61616/g.146725  ORF Transcript_61616/g.146725 Transcript_61616/m.146725 type:complete len:209 (-) Transcript_61616:1917-2543(-)